MGRPKIDRRTPEQMEAEQLQNHFNLFIKDVFVNEPTRQFEVGDVVIYGRWENATVLEKIDSGKFYLIGGEVDEGRDGIKKRKTYVCWHDIILERKNNPCVFRKDDNIHMQYGQTTLDSLLHKVYQPGVDFDVDYQRDYVWTLEDKVALIDSIMENADIGKFAFIRRDYAREKRPNGKLYEILDGKQRLSTLVEFFEDRFEYKGLKFSQMSQQDKWHFESYSVNYADIDGTTYTRKQILELFYRLNKHGKIMEQKHLERVKRMIEEIH